VTDGTEGPVEVPPTPPVPPPHSSAFLTPQVPYETVETGSAGPPAAVAPGGPPGRGRKPALLAVALVLIALVAVLAVVVLNGGGGGIVSSGPPSAPAGLVGKARTCAPPACTAVQAIVTLTWGASSGDPTAYDVYRNGTFVGSSDGVATTFSDANVPVGDSVAYTVSAKSDAGASPTSAPITVKTPLPALATAQLNGVYRVVEVVTRASNLGSFVGINHPSPGSRKKTTWTFEAACAPDRGPCPTAIFGQHPPLKVHGRTYTGSPQGPAADCLQAGHTPAHSTYHLLATRAKIASGTWTVKAFTGTLTVTFTCPGGFTSSGTVRVTGTYGS
jgi:hypothetical protein